jgi:hypothetical protein
VSAAALSHLMNALSLAVGIYSFTWMVVLPSLAKLVARWRLDSYKALAALGTDSPPEAMMYANKQLTDLMPMPPFWAAVLHPYRNVYEWGRDYEAWSLVHQWAMRECKHLPGEGR